jgi:hypothetical protein
MRIFDFERAIHDALAVYYFPGMWEWNRAIVLPLVLEGFHKSMRKQRDKYSARHELSAEEDDDWNHHLKLGEVMLEHYFEWAPKVDRFAPIQVETEFEVNIPDPDRPGHDLVVPDSVPILPIRYRGRIDMLLLDEYNSYWLIDHRLAIEKWEETDQLLLDEQGVSHCWALEHLYPGMRVAGVIYNELRKVTPYGLPQSAEVNLSTGGNQDMKHEAAPIVQNRRIYMQAIREPDFGVKQQGNELFRRTQIPRRRDMIENFGRQIVLEVRDMTDTEIRLYPNPSSETCSICPFRRPCIAMTEGRAIDSILEISYRKRGHEEAEEGRLGGSTWSMDRGAMPPKFRLKD